jgi:uncharacterized protein (TIGR04255 family)
MSEEWKTLSNPPVILSIFQIRFRQREEFDFLEFLQKNDKQIRKKYPKRNDGYHSNIGVPGTLTPGVSFVKAKADTHIEKITYATEDLKQKIDLEKNSIAYLFEGNYAGWDIYKEEAIEALCLFEEQLKKCDIIRTSIRFINKFQFKEFDDPLEYFNTTISTDSDSKLQYPVTRFSYKFGQQVPDTTIRTIVNHSLEKIQDSFDYYFDIDVLDDDSYEFDTERVKEKMEILRHHKNTIFFETLKPKTLDLCD